MGRKDVAAALMKTLLPHEQNEPGARDSPELLSSTFGSTRESSDGGLIFPRGLLLDESSALVVKVTEENNGERDE